MARSMLSALPSERVGSRSPEKIQRRSISFKESTAVIDGLPEPANKGDVWYSAKELHRWKSDMRRAKKLRKRLLEGGHRRKTLEEYDSLWARSEAWYNVACGSASRTRRGVRAVLKMQSLQKSCADKPPDCEQKLAQIYGSYAKSSIYAALRNAQQDRQEAEASGPKGVDLQESQPSLKHDSNS